MSESSDNPAEGEKPVLNPDVAAKPEEGAGASSVQALPRARRLSNGPAGVESSPAPGDQHISLNELMALAKTLGGPPSEVTDPSEGGDRGTISRQQRKFARAETRPGAGKLPEPAPVGETLALPKLSDLPDPLGIRESGLPAMTRRSRRIRVSRGPGWIAPVSFILAVAALIAVGWFVFKLAKPAAAPAASIPLVGKAAPTGEKPLAALDGAQLETVDKIMAARRADDPAKALALCVLLRSQGASIPGLAYQEAQFAAAANDTAAASLAIDRSLQANEEVAGCHLLRAALLSRGGRPDVALREYGAAAQADPFSSKPFFFWGEALRRSGRPQAALVRLDEAIDRADSLENAETYRYKRRLTLVEMDRSAEFAGELKAKLALNPPPADWVMTAAAQELRAGRYDAAGTYLTQAAGLMPPDEFAGRLRDYFFFGYAYEPTLAKVYAPVLQTAAASPATSPAASPEASSSTLNPPAGSPAPAR